jgi:hypothetical protein
MNMDLDYILSDDFIANLFNFYQEIKFYFVSFLDIYYWISNTLIFTFINNLTHTIDLEFKYFILNVFNLLHLVLYISTH